MKKSSGSDEAKMQTPDYFNYRNTNPQCQLTRFLLSSTTPPPPNTFNFCSLVRLAFPQLVTSAILSPFPKGLNEDLPFCVSLSLCHVYDSAFLYRVPYRDDAIPRVKFKMKVPSSFLRVDPGRERRSGDESHPSQH